MPPTLRTTELEELILIYLARIGDLGQFVPDIHQAIECATHRTCVRNSIYVALDRMIARRLAERFLDDTRRPAKLYRKRSPSWVYRITERGRGELTEIRRYRAALETHHPTGFGVNASE